LAVITCCRQRPLTSTKCSASQKKSQSASYVKNLKKQKRTGDMRQMEEVIITIAVMFIGAIVGIVVVVALLHFFAD
jgi:hypothetical protein